MVQTWHSSILASIWGVLHPFSPHTSPTHLFFSFLAAHSQKLYLGLPWPQTIHCTVRILGELLRALFQTQEVHPAVCNRWPPRSLSNCRGQHVPHSGSAALLGRMLLLPPRGCHHPQPCVTTPHQLLALGKGGTLEVGGKLCSLFPITWQRIWKVVEAGNPVTKLPLEESWVLITKHSSILTSQRSSWCVLMPGTAMDGQNSICPRLVFLLPRTQPWACSLQVPLHSHGLASSCF